MQQLEFTGLTGTSTWDASGAVTKLPKVYKIENGAYVEQ